MVGRRLAVILSLTVALAVLSLHILLLHSRLPPKLAPGVQGPFEKEEVIKLARKVGAERSDNQLSQKAKNIRSTSKKWAVNMSSFSLADDKEFYIEGVDGLLVIILALFGVVLLVCLYMLYQDLRRQIRDGALLVSF